MPDFTPKFIYPEHVEWIDTHGHVNFNAFKDDGEEVIKKALDNGIGIIMPGSQIDTSKRSVEYAEKLDHPYIKAAIGLHPIHLEDIEVDDSEVGNQDKFHTRKEEFRRAAYEDLLKSSDKIVAIGEVGLDYWRLPNGLKEREFYKERQIETLNNQLDLAVQYKKPVILHCRKAHDDLLSMLEGHIMLEEPHHPGVIHCYTGSKTQLRAFLALGFYIGYNGIIFKMNLDDVIKETPLDRILLETDSPYLTPPQLGDVRNEPSNVKLVAEKIAELKQVSVDEVARQTTENAKAVFRL
jgi:TatD DNase family protein